MLSFADTCAEDIDMLTPADMTFTPVAPSSA